MRVLRSAALSLALALATLASLPATEARAEPTRQEWAEWNQLVGTARKAMREGRAGEAVEALQRADTIHKSPTLDYELGMALAASGKLVEARALLGRLAETTDSTILVKRARDSAKKALAELSPRVPSLRVTVNGAAGASLTIDGKPAASGSDLPMNPGDHTVRASAEGFRAAERTVRLSEGTRESITLELTAAPTDTSAVDASGGAASSGSRVPGFALIGVGGAGLVVGGVLGGLAFSAASSAKSVCNGNACPASASDDISRSKTYGNVSTGAFIGGGVIAAVGIVLAIVAPGGGKGAEPPKAGITPLVGAGTIGIAGRF